jgi:hypothetical protein
MFYSRKFNFIKRSFKVALFQTYYMLLLLFLSILARLKKTKTDCTFESRLGATIEVNRKYNKNNRADMVTVSV